MGNKTLIAIASTLALGTAAFALAPAPAAMAGKPKIQGYLDDSGFYLDVRVPGKRHDGIRKRHWYDDWDDWYPLPRKRCLRPIRARAVAGGYGPPWVKRWRARRKAIRKWRRKVTFRFGPRFNRWRRARGKDVFCDRFGGRFECFVRARPCAPRFVDLPYDYDLPFAYRSKNKAKYRP